MNKALSALRNGVGHELISGTFFLFVGGLLGSFFSFIYNLFLARTLTQEDYGSYTSLLSFETLAVIPAASLTAIIVRFATHYFARNEESKAVHLYKRMSWVWFLIGLFIASAVYLIHPLILNYLHLDEPLLILAVGLGVGFGYVGVVNTGFLQSLLKFPYMSFSQIAGSIAKVIVGGALVLAGARVFGALVGILMLPLVIYILGFWPLRGLIGKKSSSEEKMDTREIVSYGLVTALGVIALSSFISMDVILAKHFLSPEQAGLYGGLSIIGKVIFYFTISIPAVMFPLIVKKHSNGENYRGTFHLALLLVFIPSIAITVFYYLFPGFTVNLFLGNNYVQIVPYLALFGLFITIFNLLNVTVNFFLSIKKTEISYLVFLFAVVQIILIYIFHDNFYQIIIDSILSISLLLIILLVYYKFRTD